MGEATWEGGTYLESDMTGGPRRGEWKLAT